MNPALQEIRPCDLIGDVHGDHDRLLSLLGRLGYRKRLGSWTQPEGRVAIFVGDVIDRGPKVADTLRLVRALVGDGAAQMILGNHEHNFLCYHQPDGRGGFLRPRTEKNHRLCAETVTAFDGRDVERTEFLLWLRRLPFCLDLPGLRVVHAQWDDTLAAHTTTRTELSDEDLRQGTRPGTLEYRAVGTLLKGSEMELPAGVTITDGHGIVRDKMRMRWPALRPGISYQEAAFPPCPKLPHLALPEEALARHPAYPAHAKPVFFGHYNLRGWEPRPQAPNAACLDYGCGKGGLLTAYRWEGEQVLQSDRFVQV